MLITTKSSTHPSEYLWEVNCAIYATSVSWKRYNGEKQVERKKTIKTKIKPKWLTKTEKKIEQLRGEFSQITEETRRLTNNTKLTKKTKDQQEVDSYKLKSKITKDSLFLLKEDKIQKIRILKHQRDKSIKALKRKTPTNGLTGMSQSFTITARTLSNQTPATNDLNTKNQIKCQKDEILTTWTRTTLKAFGGQSRKGKQKSISMQHG